MGKKLKNRLKDQFDKKNSPYGNAVTGEEIKISTHAHSTGSVFLYGITPTNHILLNFGTLKCLEKT